MNAPALQIRPLADADLEAYKTLRDAMLAAHPDAFTSDAQTERLRDAASYRSRLGAPGDAHFTLGAFAGEVLVGAISCERDERLKVRHVGHIVGMMVAASARGQGIGRALLLACIERARSVPQLQMLTLSVTDGNAAAQGLYLAAGFRPYGLLPKAIQVDGRYHAKALMVREL